MLAAVLSRKVAEEVRKKTRRLMWEWGTTGMLERESRRRRGRRRESNLSSQFPTWRRFRNTWERKCEELSGGKFEAI